MESSLIACEQAKNMMIMCEHLLADWHHRKDLYDLSKSNDNRCHAIKWMKEVVLLANMAPEARDTSVQIFDKYLSASLVHDPTVLSNVTILPLVATACVLLGSKVHDNKSLLTTASFPHFSCEDLVSCERMILARIDFCVVPLATPSAFVSVFISIWLGDVSKGEVMSVAENIMRTADNLISELLEEPEYLIYSPSTIAFSALLLSFLHLHIDCTDWMRWVPENCRLIENNMNRFPHLVDVDECLQCFQRLISAHQSSSMEPESPKSVKRSDNASPCGVDLMDSPVSSPGGNAGHLLSQNDSVVEDDLTFRPII